MKNKKLYFDKNIELIQEIRLLHALAETGIEINIPKDQKYKFKIIEDLFDLEIGTDSQNNYNLSDIVSIDHKAPRTAIGEISRSLIFPHQITNHCYLNWKSDRKYQFSFSGWVTKKRKLVLENWLFKNLEIDLIIPDHKNKFLKFFNKFFPKSNHKNLIQWSNKQVFISSSGYGRKFPKKAWDSKYFEILTDSKFVLCPKGNSTWTYRFFEAILCGAIPIVEESHEIYSGFHFYYLNDSITELRWNKKLIERNFDRCVEKITVKKEEWENEFL